MSYSVEVDLGELDQAVQDVIEKLGGAGEMLANFLEQRIIPILRSEAGSQRRVRTGTYMNTWEAEQEDAESAVVTTEAPYWTYLEFGTSRGIEPMPVVGDAVDAIHDELGAYLSNAMSVGT